MFLQGKSLPQVQEAQQGKWLPQRKSRRETDGYRKANDYRRVLNTTRCDSNSKKFAQERTFRSQYFLFDSKLG